MISVARVAGALYGVLLLLRFDERAVDYFDRSPGGFLRSFLPAVILTPMHLLYRIIVYDAGEASLAFAPYLIVHILSDIISWITFPFAMLYITDLLSRRERYLWHIVPYNWLQLPVGLMFFPVMLLAELGVVPVQVESFVSLLSLTLFFTFATFLARVGLRISMTGAIGVVVVDLFLMIAANHLVTRI